MWQTAPPAVTPCALVTVVPTFTTSASDVNKGERKSLSDGSHDGVEAMQTILCRPGTGAIGMDEQLAQQTGDLGPFVVGFSPEIEARAAKRPCKVSECVEKMTKDPTRGQKIVESAECLVLEGDVKGEKSKGVDDDQAANLAESSGCFDDLLTSRQGYVGVGIDKHEQGAPRFALPPESTENGQQIAESGHLVDGDEKSSDWSANQREGAPRVAAKARP